MVDQGCAGEIHGKDIEIENTNPESGKQSHAGLSLIRKDEVAFENVCFRHIDQIKKALDIYGVHTTHSAWFGYDEELGGAQIDLILDRDDHVLNTVKENSYQDGISAGKQEILPWLIGTGIVTVGAVAYGGYSFVKAKIDKKKHAKAQLAKNAEESERILTETPMHEDIIKEIEKDNKKN